MKGVMDRRGRYYVATFGCRVNQADSASLADELNGAGLERTRTATEADIVVLNTCTVTHRSDVDVRKTVARLQREAPHAKVVVAGCFAQRDPQAAASLSGVAGVVGNAHKSRLPIIVDNLRRAPSGTEPLVFHSDMATHPLDELPVEPAASVLDRTRPFVKIQDGCDAHCTYCIIPDVRGPARGADPERVTECVRTLVSQGYFEIVLTGIHLGTYIHQNAEGLPTNLVQLVDRLLQLPDLGRLRISCIEPMAFPMELAQRARDNRKLAPHFHLPLQSGSDQVLKRMVRPYRAEDFRALLHEIRELVPGVCLGTDVIVGFPGETDEDFMDTVECVRKSGADYVHVFSYSDRAAGTGRGTPSTRLEPKIDPRVIKERATHLSTVSQSLWGNYLERQIGHQLPGIVLGPDPRKPQRVKVLTENFCKVDCGNDELKAGDAVTLHIIERCEDRLIGRVA